MPALLKPTYSRWGRSVYETAESIRLEAELLSDIAEDAGDSQDAEIMVVHSKLKVGEALLTSLQKPTLVVTTTSGHEHMDLPYLWARGIRTTRMPVLRRDAVVETALGMILDGLRKFWHFRSEARHGHWARGDLPEIAPKLLSHSKVGIVGHGVIGSRMAQSLTDLGAHVVTCDPKGLPPSVESCRFQDMVDCDVLSLHCDLNETSRNIVDAPWLARIRPGMVLVNTARGGLVDERAAIESLDNGSLSYLGLDVFASEPYGQLLQSVSRPNLCLTPHAAGYHPSLGRGIALGLEGIFRSYVAGDQVDFELLQET
jgi:glycerate dehydrogenase